MQESILTNGYSFLDRNIRRGAEMYASGKVVRKLIAERDTSQAALSRATGINKQNISLICNGKTQYPSIHTCKRIAEFFGLTLDEFWALIEAEE